MPKRFLGVAILIIVIGTILVWVNFSNRPNKTTNVTPTTSNQSQQVQNNTTTTPAVANEDICTNAKEILIRPEDTNTQANSSPERIKSPEVLLKYINQCPNNPEVINKIAIPDLDIKYNQTTRKYSFVQKSENTIRIVKWNQKADFEKDGTNEIVIGVIDTFYSYPYGGVGYFQSLAIFKKEGLNWKISHQETNTDGSYRLEAIEDMKGDGKPELIVSASGSGATTGYINTSILEENKGNWRNIGEFTTLSPSPDSIKIKDINSDGIKEITSHGGGIASAGAGFKQRQKISVYKYNLKSNKFEFSGKTYDPIEDNYFRMLDAYYALSNNKLDEALNILNQAIQKPRWQIFSNKFGIESEEKPAEAYVNDPIAQKITAYITNEIMLTYAAKSSDSLPVIDGLLNQITSQFSQIQNTSTQPYLEGAKALRDTFATTKDYRQACQAMENKIASFGKSSEFFNEYGYAEEHLKPENTCPFNKTTAPDS